MADEIAEPRPDPNIKVAAFTVTKKFYNTLAILQTLKTIECSCIRVHSVCCHGKKVLRVHLKRCSSNKNQTAFSGQNNIGR